MHLQLFPALQSTANLATQPKASYLHVLNNPLTRVVFESYHHHLSGPSWAQQCLYTHVLTADR